jgi:hypothetical protein
VAADTFSTSFNRKAICSLAVEQGARLPAFARPADLGQMGTEIVRIDPGIFRRQQLIDPAFDRPVILLGQQSPGDARLIGDHNGEQACLIDLPHGSPDAGQQPDLPGIAGIARVVDQRPVPVEEHRALHS